MVLAKWGFEALAGDACDDDAALYAFILLTAVDE
jgi:hypothetical protein